MKKEDFCKNARKRRLFGRGRLRALGCGVVACCRSVCSEQSSLATFRFNRT